MHGVVYLVVHGITAMASCRCLKLIISVVSKGRWRWVQLGGITWNYFELLWPTQWSWVFMLTVFRAKGFFILLAGRMPRGGVDLPYLLVKQKRAGTRTLGLCWGVSMHVWRVVIRHREVPWEAVGQVSRKVYMWRVRWRAAAHATVPQGFCGGFQGGLVVKHISYQWRRCRRHQLDPGL